MQPVRVIIAAIFFVIGALIVIPAFTGGNSSSDAASTSDPTPTPTASPSSSSPSSTPKATATKSASESPSPSKTASPSATPTATKPPASAPATATKTPTPTPAVTSTTAKPVVQPLTVSFGSIKCPSNKVNVKVTNDTDTGQSYSITRNTSLVLADRLGPGSSRTSTVTLTEDKTVVVRVTQNDKPQASRSYKLNCAKSGAASSAKPTTAERLPYTGTDDTVMVARLATGAASILTGAIILWWGGLWPRRKDGMFGSADRG